MDHRQVVSRLPFQPNKNRPSRSFYLNLPPLPSSPASARQNSHSAWFFFKTMNVSGAEAVVAAASPFIGQGESACLVRPYADLMTPSEIHLTMTSGFSTISGSVLAAYIFLGIPASTLITSSVMSIPASIAISKMRYPETEEPVTRTAVVVDRGVQAKNQPNNALHAFSHGATFGLMVAGQIL